MHALLIGTGGAYGWPEDGCRCASCMSARHHGLHRRPGRVLVDGTLDFSPTQQVMPGTGQSGRLDHRVAQLAGGFDVTGPDGSRLLLASGPGQIPEPPAGSAPYDIALLDLLASPAQLGRLRAAGLVREHTAVVALYADHRVRSEQELTRRCALWQAVPAQDGQLITSLGPGVPAVIPAPGMLPARPHRTLIIGGRGSGRLAEAELRLAAEPQVTYLTATARRASGVPATVVTARPTRRPTIGSQPGPAILPDDQPGPDLPPGRQAGPPTAGAQAYWPDGEASQRWVAPPVLSRSGPQALWQATESADFAGALARETGGLLIDGIGAWLAAVMTEAANQAAGPAAAGDAAVMVAGKIEEIIAAWRHTRALVVAVTDHAETGLAPSSQPDRAFQDQLGWLNQRLAAESELNLLVVAGRVTTLPG